jgi:hypothetical protein
VNPTLKLSVFDLGFIYFQKSVATLKVCLIHGFFSCERV